MKTRLLWRPFLGEKDTGSVPKHAAINEKFCPSFICHHSLLVTYSFPLLFLLLASGIPSTESKGNRFLHENTGDWWSRGERNANLNTSPGYFLSIPSHEENF